MKKILYFITIVILFTTTKVYAKSDIYSINMDIYLEQNGNMNITEKWDVKAEDGSEWFKQIKNIDDIEITNYSVYMDGDLLTEKVWNVNEGLEAKRGYFGKNKIDNGIELCFGKYDYNRHIFTIKYTMTNAIINTEDAQVLIGKIVNEMPKHNFENFEVIISSYYAFPNNLDVWGTGYKGLAYVKDGKIYLSNKENPQMGENSYASVLVKFPLNTFTSTRVDDRYKTFDDVKTAFMEGTFDNRKASPWATIIPLAIFGLAVGGILFAANKSGYGYINNKKIKEKETPAFRDIPCKKDLFYANALIKLNSLFSSIPSSLASYMISNIFCSFSLSKVTFLVKSSE